MSQTPAQPESEPTERAGRPPTLLIGLAVALLEAVALAAIGVVSLVLSLADNSTYAGFAAGVLVILVLIGGLLFLAVRALWRGRRWGRGPVITWQLLQFAAGASSFGTVVWWAAVIPMVAAVVVVVALLVPSSLAATATAGGPDAVA